VSDDSFCSVAAGPIRGYSSLIASWGLRLSDGAVDDVPEGKLIRLKLGKYAIAALNLCHPSSVTSQSPVSRLA